MMSKTVKETQSILSMHPGTSHGDYGPLDVPSTIAWIPASLAPAPTMPVGCAPIAYPHWKLTKSRMITQTREHDLTASSIIYHIEQPGRGHYLDPGAVMMGLFPNHVHDGQRRKCIADHDVTKARNEMKRMKKAMFPTQELAVASSVDSLTAELEGRTCDDHLILIPASSFYEQPNEPATDPPARALSYSNGSEAQLSCSSATPCAVQHRMLPPELQDSYSRKSYDILHGPSVSGANPTSSEATVACPFDFSKRKTWTLCTTSLFGSAIEKMKADLKREEEQWLEAKRRWRLMQQARLDALPTVFDDSSSSEGGEGESQQANHATANVASAWDSDTEDEDEDEDRVERGDANCSQAQHPAVDMHMVRIEDGKLIINAPKTTEMLSRLVVLGGQDAADSPSEMPSIDRSSLASKGGEKKCENWSQLESLLPLPNISEQPVKLNKQVGAFYSTAVTRIVEATVEGEQSREGTYDRQVAICRVESICNGPLLEP